MKVDLRARLDDLETAAWRAWQDAKREGEPLTDDLAAIFRNIEALINAYEEDGL